MTRNQAVEKIYDSRGKFFSVKFVKRSNGEIRVMNCRIGVRKYLKGGELGYDRKDNGLIGVYDVKNNGYRSVAIEGIIEFNGGKVTD